MSPNCVVHDRVYTNAGNVPLVALIQPPCRRVLDVGCGAGDTARRIRERFPASEIVGITHSAAEAELTKDFITDCWVLDVETELPPHVKGQQFDVLVFSHVLEHLKDPARVLSGFTSLLSSGGQVLIAVPNILSWRMRVQFLRGSFRYESAGILDDTHLRFFTYETADEYLLSESPDLIITHKLAEGSVPLGPLRSRLLPGAWRRQLDRWGSSRWPNLFGGQTLIRAVKR
jgi:2-polyprenyl-3-methyl-5-hydroxy-6-metoxy-1,4-benzoquinol methylase